MNLESTPAILTSDEAAVLDLDQITVIDVRPWQHYRARHARRALWSAPGAWFPASVGSFVQRDQPVVLLIDGSVTEQYVRLLYRIGIDRIEGVMTPEVFEAAADRMETEASQEIDAHEFQQHVEAGNTRIVDVRNPDEFERGCVPNAVHVPYTRLAENLDKLPPPGDEPLLVHCQAGLRSAMAISFLRQHGYHPVNIAGGYGAWNMLASRRIPS
jgi:hydroxyacylglutathione hydrolase